MAVNCHRTSRTMLACAAALKKGLSQQVRLKSHATSSHINARSLSLASNAWQQLALKEEPIPDHAVAWASTERGFLRVEFGDGTFSDMPYAWLRNRCKCSQCSRFLSLDSYVGETDHDVHPEIIQRTESGLVIDWSDGHISKYSADWLRSAIFIPPYCDVHTYAEAT
ncbi:gamma-butyrobetaine dioxygenase-like [Macrobrachium rosenbergii]|uniref:gamma-butyrobetaine dioxygenase-like n=1 Tax=Macrobrachium rosenbergii TaxID=79674 RepID=UPI0034D3A390